MWWRIYTNILRWQGDHIVFGSFYTHFEILKGIHASLGGRNCCIIHVPILWVGLGTLTPPASTGSFIRGFNGRLMVEQGGVLIFRVHKEGLLQWRCKSKGL